MSKRFNKKPPLSPAVPFILPESKTDCIRYAIKIYEASENPHKISALAKAWKIPEWTLRSYICGEAKTSARGRPKLVPQEVKNSVGAVVKIVAKNRFSYKVTQFSACIRDVFDRNDVISGFLENVPSDAWTPRFMKESSIRLKKGKHMGKPKINSEEVKLWFENAASGMKGVPATPSLSAVSSQ